MSPVFPFKFIRQAKADLNWLTLAHIGQPWIELLDSGQNLQEMSSIVRYYHVKILELVQNLWVTVNRFANVKIFGECSVPSETKSAL